MTSSYSQKVAEELRKHFPLKELKTSTEPFERPEVEYGNLKTTPILIEKTKEECALIEAASNSIRISLRIKKSTELEAAICKQFCQALMKRATTSKIFRRSPIPSYDLSLLLTATHLKQASPEEYIAFIVDLIERANKEINATKIEANSQTRKFVAEWISLITG